MSAASPPVVAVVLPPREGFGPRRARGIGLTARDHALGTPHHRTIVLGDRQRGPVFPAPAFQSVFVPFSLPGLGPLSHALVLVRHLRRLKPALIEVHAAPLLALWLQSFFPKVPVALFLHDDPGASRVLREPGKRTLLLRRLARVIAVSGWLRDRVMEGVEPGVRPPVVVPPCVDLSALPPSDAEADAHRPPSRRRARLILYAGRLTPDKGADRFVSACTTALPRLSGWRAEVIGAAEHRVDSPETPFTQMLRAIADPAGIALLGYRDHPDLMLAMSRAAIVAVPAAAPEASGRVVLEAMANGAAVICPRAGGLPEIGDDSVLYADPADLGAAIRALAEDTPRLALLARAGRERAALFGHAVVGRWLETVRERIIAGGVPGI